MSHAHIPSPSGTPKSVETSAKQQHQQSSGKKSPFRNFRLRASAKRARESSPAETTPATGGRTTSSLAHFSRRDGFKMRKSDDASRKASGMKTEVKMDDEENGDGDGDGDPDPGPIMPEFLTLDRDGALHCELLFCVGGTMLIGIDIDAKFDDINWDERMRIAKGQPNHPNFEWSWGSHKHPELEKPPLQDRYTNIKPWNHNRVKLNVPDGYLDYVNASSIVLNSPSDSSRPPFRYIAMQGPTEPSIPYVWRMIAEQLPSPSVIIQLTSNFENGALKCNQYFPDAQVGQEWELNSANIWGDGWNANLKYKSFDLLCEGAIERRRLALHVEGEKEPRDVWHFWYRRWPDFGVPGEADLDVFFELMRLSREHNSPMGPRVIHCSAGVGRTGTFITLEHLIRELDVGALCDPSPEDGQDGETTKPDLIYDTVQNLRRQRRGMVQNEQQYRFIYQVLKKLWTERYTPPKDEDDEEETDGGVALGKADGSSTLNKDSSSSSDPFWDAENDDNDDDDGGAKVNAAAN